MIVSEVGKGPDLNTVLPGGLVDCAGPTDVRTRASGAGTRSATEGPACSVIRRAAPAPPSRRMFDFLFEATFHTVLSCATPLKMTDQRRHSATMVP